MPSDPTWDETTASEPSWEDTTEVQTAPSPITLSPYQKYRMSGREPVAGPFGPASPQEVLSLPQVLKAPAAAIEATGIPGAVEEIGADFLRRTGINPSAQPGVSLVSPGDSTPPSPLEEAFPNVTRGIESGLRRFLTPGGVVMTPLLPLKPVQTAFEAQMLSGVPESTESLIRARSPEEVAEAGIGLAAGLGAGRALFGRRAPKFEETTPVEPTETATTPTPEPISEQIPPAGTTGEAQPSAAPGGGGVEKPADTGSTPQPKGEVATVEPPTQAKDVTKEVTEPEIVPMGGDVYGANKPPEGTPTSTKNAVVDQERVKRGLPPAIQPARESFGEVWDRAMAHIDRDPEYPDNLIDDLTKNPRAPSPEENATLLHRQIDLQNEYAKATRDLAQAFEDGRQESVDSERVRVSNLVDQLGKLYDLDKKVGTAAGRALNVRRMMANEDFTLSKMTMDQRAAKGGAPLTPEETLKIQALHDRIAETQRALDEHISKSQVRISDLEKQVAEAPKFTPPILKAAERIVSTLDTRANAARQRLKEKMGRFSAGVDPTIIADLAEIGASHIAHIGLDFAKWSTEMVKELGEWVRPHLDEAYAASQKAIDSISGAPEAVKSAVKTAFSRLSDEEKVAATVDAVKQRVADNKKDEIAFFVQRLARSLVADGVRNRDALIDRVHAVLQQAIPDITKRQTMDAISGYGDFKQLSKDEISVALRGMKGEMQQVAKLEDLESKKPLLKSGVERRTPTDEERKLISQVEEAKRKYGVVVTDPETQLKSALDARKTYYRNQITDLEKQIAAKEKFVPERTPPPTDPELEALKARRTKLKEDFDEIFGKPGQTNEQYERMLQRDKENLQKSIAEKEAKLKSGNVAPEPKEMNRPAERPELEELKQRREQLNKQIAQARKKPADQRYAESLQRRLESMNKAIAEKEAQIASGNVAAKVGPQNRPLPPDLEVAKQKLDTLNKQIDAIRNPKKTDLEKLKSRLSSIIKRYEDRIANGDYAPQTPQPKPLDPEASRLKAQVERVKKEFQKGVELERFKNAQPFERGAHWINRWTRGFLLSGPAVLGKLTAAAFERLAFTPVEEGVGAAYSKAFPRLAARAPREGGFSPSAESKAIVRGITSGARDAWDLIKTGESDLDALYGKSSALPSSFLDFFGRVHGALKSVTKRAEFERSMQKRVEWGRQNGVDVTDPWVQMKMGMEAYKDANRSIFMQDNRVVNAYRRGIAALEQKNKLTGEVPALGKAGATAARVALPIVKVPTNIVAETMQHVFGTYTGAWNLAKAYKAGIETLKPEQADLIMRQLKKGTLGTAALVTGFLLPNAFGGYYQKGEKRKPGDTKVGAIKLFGHNIPSFLLHNPLLETLQIGATVRRVMDAHLRKGEGPITSAGEGLYAGAAGVTEEVPFFRELLDFVKAFDPKQKTAFIGEFAKSRMVPNAISWAAQHYDTDKNGKPIIRAPKTIVQHIETGIPGLREKVPKKKGQ